MIRLALGFAVAVNLQLHIPYRESKISLEPDSDDEPENADATQLHTRTQVLATVASSGHIAHILPEAKPESHIESSLEKAIVIPLGPTTHTLSTASIIGCAREGDWGPAPPNVVLYNLDTHKKRACTIYGWDEVMDCGEVCGNEPLPGGGGAKFPCNSKVYGPDGEFVGIGDCKGGVIPTSKPSDTVSYDFRGIRFTDDEIQNIQKGRCQFFLINDCSDTSVKQPNGGDCAIYRSLGDNQFGLCECWTGHGIKFCTQGDSFQCYNACKYCPKSTGYAYTKPGATVAVPEHSVRRFCKADGTWDEEECYTSERPCIKRETESSTKVVASTPGSGFFQEHWITITIVVSIVVVVVAGISLFCWWKRTAPPPSPTSDSGIMRQEDF